MAGGGRTVHEAVAADRREADLDLVANAHHAAVSRSETRLRLAPPQQTNEHSGESGGPTLLRRSDESIELETLVCDNCS